MELILEHKVIARFLILRFLGFLYSLAFIGILFQFRPLFGENGLLPSPLFLNGVQNALDSSLQAYWELPTLFWFHCSDSFMTALAILGLVLSLALMLGFANVPLLFSLWGIYLSFCHTGQLFYGYGWEMLLLETTFLSLFMCPLWKGFGIMRQTPVPSAVLWLFRWLAFRLMFGAGLIKLRGDPCWRDLTCLIFHFETQPLPNPISPLLHSLPHWFLKFGVLFNHFVEIIVPWFLLGPKPYRYWAAIVTILFQLMLILSGNLSFLNYLTLLVCLACFDDGLWEKLGRKMNRPLNLPSSVPLGSGRTWATVGYCLVVAVLSFRPAVNMLSPDQSMNRSFDPFHLVNTYGAFGYIGKERPELIIEGTRDSVLTDSTIWQAYEFKCKPGGLDRAPCVVSPYHYRLDWQIWFAAMSTAEREPWLIHFVYKLLLNDPETIGLIEKTPFHGAPPRFVRIEKYTYRFAQGDGWWEREWDSSFLPPVSLRHKNLNLYLKQFGWI